MLKEESVVITPVDIGPISFQSRLGLAPFNTGLFERNGDASSKCLAFYSQYCDSPIGVLYIGGVAISSSGRANRQSLVLDSTEQIAGLRKVVAVAHKEGVKVIVQLEHAGRQANPNEIGTETVAASAIPCPVVGGMPRELLVSEIQGIIRGFGKSAAVVEQSGADMVEIHAAHGYLVSGFLSHYSNNRTDSYGGVVLNRFRILEEIIAEVRLCTSLPIGLRINCHENIPNGLSLDDVIAGLTRFKNALTYVSVSGGVYTKHSDVIIPSRAMPKALWRVAAKVLREKLNIPIFLGGNIDTISLAENLINEKAADVVLMGRALLSDPLLARKYLVGKTASIQECTDCGMCRWHSRNENHIYCPFNSILSRKSWQGAPSGVT